MDDDFLIEYIEHEVENGCIDFKKDIYDFDVPKCKEDFLVDVISFANSHINGDKYIITGIKLHKDNSRDFNGITESKIKDGADYQSIVNDNIEPNIVVDFKIIEYKNKKYGIFRIGKENQDQPYLLSKQFLNLQKGFIRIRKGQKNENITRRDFDLYYKIKDLNDYSNIHIKGIVDGKISDKYQINQYNDNLNFEKAKSLINETIVEIKKIKLAKSSNFLAFGDLLSLDEKEIETIKTYAQLYSIVLTDDFFDIGNIRIFTGPYSSASLYGSKTEEKKYKLIRKLITMISSFLGFDEYYKKINSIYYTELLIKNEGKKFDEDIEVTLKIEKSKLLNYSKFPVPPESIIEKIIDDKLLDKHLNNQKVNGVNNYTCKIPRIFPTYPMKIKLPIGYSKPDYKEYVDYYINYVQTIADYDVSEDEDYYYLKYNQREIKPNELIHLPARIIFIDKPNEIEYEIKTKYNSNINKGKISLIEK
ncbi:MAG: putative DNA binding domain-containing protein [Bacilli bacterium]|nr:putative DNA binding domain-containing protein [Bacilli bacterium]